ncbi:MAG: TolB family protein, partial [Thermoguttaceae bacterium]
MRPLVYPIAFLFMLAVSVTAFSADQLVFDFESGSLEKEGDGLGWQIVSGTNTKPIGSRDTEFHNNSAKYQKQGKYYLTTLESAADANPTDDTICVIESPVFTITGKEAKFLVGGGKRPKTYVALCVFNNGIDKAPTEVLKGVGAESQGLDEKVFDIASYIGKDAFFRVVDEEKGGWAHIRADNFRIDAKMNADKTKKYRESISKIIAAKKLQELKDELVPIQKAVEKTGDKQLKEKLEKFTKTVQTQNVFASPEKFAEELSKLKKEILESNPLVVSHPILYVSRPQYVPDHHNTETMFQTGEICTSSFRGGAALKVWNPKTNKTKSLIELPDGSLRDPCVSFDAKKILVSLRRDINDDYHIYELAVDLERPTIVIKGGNDAKDAKYSGLTQLTFQPGLSDIDPLYLPNGEILFSSSREPKYCMCNRHIMCNLYTMNADGSNLQQIGKSTLFEGHASLLNDGRVIYDRWEYVDRNFGDAQGVWVTNPDGTNHAIFWGNNTASPGGVLDAKVIPGNDSVFISTFSSCHDRPWGAIALVDRRLGIDGKEAVLQTWPSDAINLVDVGGYDTFIAVPQKFEDPYPLSDTFFLASGMVGRGEEMGIWLLDTYGNMTLL